jgi:hypothetical protein
MKNIFLTISSLFICALMVLACNPETQSTDASDKDNYDRTALLTNWANNIIVPSYENYRSKVQVLVTDTNKFSDAPTELNLQTLRNSWLEAYKAYQYVTIYTIGKAETINFKESTNTYPTSTSGIESNIASGNYNLDAISQLDKQGFPALDYLLNGIGTSDTLIVDFYTSNTNANNYKQYLIALVNKLKSNVDVILNDWNSNFKSNFIANNGKSANSSVSITTNSFVKSFEKDIRAGKIGIPAGVFSSGVLFADKVEGFYKNDISKMLLNESIKASQDFFNGKYFGATTTGESLKSYLDYLNVVRNNEKLSVIINKQFDLIFKANNSLSESLSNQVKTDNSKMITSYDALQQNVIYIKLDMMQALNISIDYVDADGD